MEVVFKRDGQKSYMIITLERKNIEEDDYRLKMLQNNRIPGLLDVSITFVDDSIEFAYDITSKTSLDIYWMKGNVTYQQICDLHEGMFQMMWNIKKYLLRLNHVLLERRFIYLDHETHMPYFCYLLDEEYDFFQSSKHFYKELIGMIDYGDERGVKLAYELEKLAVQDDFHMDKIQEAMGWNEIDDKDNQTQISPYLQEYESPKVQEEEYNTYLEDNRKIEKEPWIEEEPISKIKETIKQKFTEMFKKKEKKVNKYHVKKEKSRDVELLKDSNSDLNELDFEQEGKKAKVYKTEILREDHQQLVLLNLHAKKNIQLVIEQPLPKILGSAKEESDFVIEDPTVSRMHVKFSNREGNYYVQDLNSTNGSKKNEEELVPYTETELKDGDLLQIGKSLLKVRIGMF